MIAATVLVFWMTRGELDSKGIAIALYVALAVVLVGSVVNETIRQNRIEYYNTWNGSYQSNDFDKGEIIISFKETSLDSTGANGEYYIFDTGTGLLDYEVVHGYYSYTGDYSLKLDCKTLKNPIVTKCEDGIVLIYETKNGNASIHAGKSSSAIMTITNEKSIMDYVKTGEQ